MRLEDFKRKILLIQNEKLKLLNSGRNIIPLFVKNKNYFNSDFIKSYFDSGNTSDNLSSFLIRMYFFLNNNHIREANDYLKKNYDNFEHKEKKYQIMIKLEHYNNLCFNKNVELSEKIGMSFLDAIEVREKYSIKETAGKLMPVVKELKPLFEKYLEKQMFSKKCLKLMMIFHLVILRNMLIKKKCF